MRSLISTLVLTLVTSISLANDASCERIKNDLLWGNDSNFLKHSSEGTLQEMLDIIREKGYLLSQKLMDEMSVDASLDNAYLYIADLDADETEDFAVVIFSGGANCGEHIFLKADDATKKLRIVNGINDSRYTNEGKLCSGWGQQLLFYKESYKDTYLLVRDYNQHNSVVTFEAFRAGINQKAEGVCKITMSVK